MQIDFIIVRMEDNNNLEASLEFIISQALKFLFLLLLFVNFLSTLQRSKTLNHYILLTNCKLISVNINVFQFIQFINKTEIVHINFSCHTNRLCFGIILNRTLIEDIYVINDSVANTRICI